MSGNHSNNEIVAEIREIKKKLGKKLLILTHHYQTEEIVSLGNFAGDSFDLSQKAAADNNAEFIIFCGVHFMAESAAVLSSPKQKVQIPDIKAGCSMADMADIQSAEKAFSKVEAISGDGSVTPVVYMNSDARIKAYCGKNNGLVCTSSNAYQAFNYAFERSEKIFLFPDEHLGRNTADKFGIVQEEIILWDPAKELGGNSEYGIKKAKIILWKGFCSIHTAFTDFHILKARKEHPDAKIVVHPECTQQVVKLADAAGSTAYIAEYVKNSSKDSTVIIGTEINMIKRLASEYNDKKILPLYVSECEDMGKINLRNLLNTLKKPGEYNVVTVSDDIKKDAKKALDRMLSLA